LRAQVTGLQSSEKLDLQDVQGMVPYFASPKDEENYEAMRKEMNEHINLARWDEALELLNLMSQKAPLEKDGLLFRLYISYQFGDMDFAADAANIAWFFYQKEQDVADLCGDLWQAMANMIQREVTA
jgi:hypothetical protein